MIVNAKWKSNINFRIAGFSEMCGLTEEQIIGDMLPIPTTEHIKHLNN